MVVNKYERIPTSAVGGWQERPRDVSVDQPAGVRRLIVVRTVRQMWCVSLNPTAVRNMASRLERFWTTRTHLWKAPQPIYPRVKPPMEGVGGYVSGHRGEMAV